MLRVENVRVDGFEAAIRGMRNPKNSWDRSDSKWVYVKEITTPGDNVDVDLYKYKIGPNDLDLMKRLYSAGTEHAKYLRMIHISMDVTAPLYWWKEADQSKIATTTNSCSTMHKIHSKELTLDDFSHEHLIGYDEASDAFDKLDEDISEAEFVKDNGGIYPFRSDDECTPSYPLDWLEETCKLLNRNRELYLQTRDKRYWWQMIQLLPSSYNQKRTWDFDYQTAISMIRQRKDHKLDEWHTLIDELYKLPYLKEIIDG